MKKITQESTLVVADDVVSCDLDGEAAILNLKNGIYYGLDPVGAKIWSLIQKPTKINFIIKNIMEEYDVDQEQCLSDTIELIEQLVNNGLVEIK